MRRDKLFNSYIGMNSVSRINVLYNKSTIYVQVNRMDYINQDNSVIFWTFGNISFILLC